jgi:hypothetical protein
MNRGRYRSPVPGCGMYGEGRQVRTSPVDPGIGFDGIGDREV